LYETQDKLDEIAMDIGLAEAVINACQAEIEKQTRFIEERTSVLRKLEKECKDTHDVLAEVKAAAEEDLRVINLILDTAKEECDKQKAAGFLQVQACLNDKGRTYFKTSNALIEAQAGKLKSTSSQQMMQRALFEMFAMEQPLPGKLDLGAFGDSDDDDESDDFPDGLMLQNGESFVQIQSSKQEPSANKASNDKQRQLCNGVGAKPKCEKILEQLSGMQGEMIDALDKATKELNEHDEWCEAEIEALNSEINNAKEIIAARTEQFDKASAFHNGMLIEHGNELQIKLDFSMNK
jgi:fructose-specific phosphotransferase system component IIB